MELDEKSFYTTQIYTAISVNLLSISFGNSYGWFSPIIKLLQSKDTPLRIGPLTKDEIELVGSAVSFGAFLFTPFYGWIADKIGRKWTLISIGIPQLISWIIIYFAQNAYHLIFARFLQGISGAGIFIVIPVFITEISQDRIRGRLGSLLILSSNLGLIMAYTAGAFIDYHTNCLLLLVIPLMFFVFVLLIHESPIYLIRNEKFKQAEEAFIFYRSAFTSRNLEMNNKIKHEYDNISAFVKRTDLGADKKLSLSDFTTKSARAAIIIALALMIFEVFNGSYALLNYASLILEEANSTLSPNASAIIVGIIQMIGASVALVLVDRAGRKFLMILSAGSCAFSLLVFSLHDYLKVIGINLSNFEYVPLVSFSLVIFGSNLGLQSLPFLLITELTPQKIQNTVYSCSLVVSWGLVYSTVALLPSTISLLGIHGTMLIFAICCIFAVIFIACFIPETKNRTIEEIQDSLSK